ncbi:hypothetical protein C8R47DRAFT_80892 [Mycena vitilis]|nr:hypothetical protein C8R47DRAFT_80892 [Mycena vitilis]
MCVFEINVGGLGTAGPLGRHLLLRSSMPVAWHLPVELADLVIKNVDADDRHTLGICGLVSRTWLALSRPILFRCISLQLAFGQSNARAFATLMRRRDRLTFLPFVQEIELAGRHPWMYTVLPRLVRYLPAFTTLRLATPWQGDASTFAPAFRNISHFKTPPSYNVGSLLAALQLTTSLQHITITTGLTSAFPVLENFRICEGNPNLPLRHLHTVELDEDWNATLIKGIMVNAPPLTTLSLGCRSDIYECLREAGRDLQTLKLIFPPHFDPPSAPTGAFTPNLKTLHLCSRNISLFHAAAALLSRAKLRPQEIVVELGEPDPKDHDVHDDETMDLSAWAELDRVLRALPGLLTVRMRVHPAWIGKIFVSLPLCQAAGKLL